jgi:hypothetical protein
MSVNGLMNQTITIASKSGYDAYGRVTTSTETTIKARVQQTTKQKFLANGDVILISAIAYVPSDTTVEIDDAVTVGRVNTAFMVNMKQSTAVAALIIFG